MPDKRRHRGRHPEDEKLFARSHHDTLRLAVCHFSWLLTHGYAERSALKLVGDRYELTARQRTAVRRCSCSDSQLIARMSRMVDLRDGRCERVALDGYNLLITIESALSGGVVLIGRDGCCRDLAGVHGTYRKVEETIPALKIIIETLDALFIPRVDCYLDQPVSNSGRLKALLAGLLEERTDTGSAKEHHVSTHRNRRVIRAAPVRKRSGSGLHKPLPHGRGSADPNPSNEACQTPGKLCDKERTNPWWNIELAADPDLLLSRYSGPVATSDSIILDRCGRWFNLAAWIIAARVPEAWIIDLR